VVESDGRGWRRGEKGDEEGDYILREASRTAFLEWGEGRGGRGETGKQGKSLRQLRVTEGKAAEALGP